MMVAPYAPIRDAVLATLRAAGRALSIDDLPCNADTACRLVLTGYLVRSGDLYDLAPAPPTRCHLQNDDIIAALHQCGGIGSVADVHAALHHLGHEISRIDLSGVLTDMVRSRGRLLIRTARATYAIAGMPFALGWQLPKEPKRIRSSKPPRVQSPKPVRLARSPKLMLPPPEPGTLAWYLAQFQADSLSQGRTAGTIYAYGSKMKPLLALGLAPHEITTDHLRPLLTGKPATRGTMRGMMRAFLQYLVTQGVIETNPAERLPRITVEPPNRKPLSADEVKALYAAALARDERAGHRAPTYRLIVLLLLQGLRRKEVVGIRWSDVHWDEGRIDVPETKGRRAHPAIPLGPDLRLALEEEPRSKPSDRLIRSSRLVYYRIKMLAADTGIERLHPHLLRHTWASTWLMEGGSPLALQQLGGWNSPIMIERYTRTVQAQAALDRGHEMNISGRMLSRNQETEIPAGLLDADDDLAAALADPKTRAMLSAFVQALKGGHDATA